MGTIYKVLMEEEFASLLIPGYNTAPEPRNATRYLKNGEKELWAP